MGPGEYGPEWIVRLLTADVGRKICFDDEATADLSDANELDIV
jgi:hypothetical protein